MASRDLLLGICFSTAAGVPFTFLGSPLNLTPNLNLNLIALLHSD